MAHDDQLVKGRLHYIVHDLAELDRELAEEIVFDFKRLLRKHAEFQRLYGP